MVLSIYNIFVMIVLTYYSRFLVSLLWVRNRVEVRRSNKVLERLRSKAVKSLEDRKRFLSVKYPVSRFKFSWWGVFSVLGNIAVYIIIFNVWLKVFSFLGWNFRFWSLILFVVLFPLLFNVVLSRFGFEKDSVYNYIFK